MLEKIPCSGLVCSPAFLIVTIIRPSRAVRHSARSENSEKMMDQSLLSRIVRKDRREVRKVAPAQYRCFLAAYIGAASYANKIKSLPLEPPQEWLKLASLLPCALAMQKMARR